MATMKNKGLQIDIHNPVFLMVRPAGFEPAALRFVEHHSELFNLLKDYKSQILQNIMFLSFAKI